jgi:flagellar biosynthesis protein FlhB
MAENQDDRSSDDLQDEPSQAKIDELRGKGQVAQSRELTAMLVLMATAITIYGYGPTIARDIMSYMREVFQSNTYSKVDFSRPGFVDDTLTKALKMIIMVSLPTAVIGFLTGLISCFAQVGAIFTFDPIQPNFEKIDPLKGMMRIFSMKSLYELLRISVKIVIALFVAYGLMKTEIYSSPGKLWADPSSLMSVFSASAKSIFLTISFIFLLFAGIDYWVQRKDWMKQVRLTKQEAKEESKERDGNPQVKSRVRSIQREMSRKRMMSAVKKADVIITNPTHIAIAIQYDRAKMMAPKVVAKGADLIAQKIRELGKEGNIPIVENVPLARTLYKSVKINQAIPRALYQAVAEVLAYVYRLKNKNFGGGN